jgi:hypothetical protein
VDDQAVSMGLEFAMGTEQRFCRWPLKERSRLSIERDTKKIVGSGVADIELDRGIEFDQLHQLNFAEASLLVRRLGLERLSAQTIYWTQGCDAKAYLLREYQLR